MNLTRAKPPTVNQARRVYGIPGRNLKQTSLTSENVSLPLSYLDPSPTPWFPSRPATPRIYLRAPSQRFLPVCVNLICVTPTGDRMNLLPLPDPDRELMRNQGPSHADLLPGSSRRPGTRSRPASTTLPPPGLRQGPSPTGWTPTRYRTTNPNLRGTKFRDRDLMSLDCSASPAAVFSTPTRSVTGSIKQIRPKYKPV